MNSPRTTDFLPGKRRIALVHELHGRTLTTHVRYSRDLRRYFRGNSFALRYSDEIHAPDSILAIPALAIRTTVFSILGEPHWMNRVESLPPESDPI